MLNDDRLARSLVGGIHHTGDGNGALLRCSIPHFIAEPKQSMRRRVIYSAFRGGFDGTVHSTKEHDVPGLRMQGPLRRLHRQFVDSRAQKVSRLRVQMVGADIGIDTSSQCLRTKTSGLKDSILERIVAGKVVHIKLSLRSSRAQN